MTRTASEKSEGGRESASSGGVMLQTSEYEALVEVKNAAERRQKKKRTKEDWRSVFALIILAGYYLPIGVCLGAWVFGFEVDNVTKVISAVGTLVGTPLGFVIGYYYKSAK